jgi:GGDEF domain-containing protein
MFIIIFGFIFLIFNYVLFCIDLSFQKKVIVLITLQNGLYYVILNSLLCTLIASLAIYLYNFYGYVPIVVMTCFIIFTSFAINSLDKLKTTNKNIKAIAECTTHIISPYLDFKTKLQHVIEVIDGIIPFVYCGIYFFREGYEQLYPLCYKSNHFITIKDLKFTQAKDNEVSRMIRLGNPIYKENSYLKDTLAIINTLSSESKYNLIIPIKHTEASIGFIILCLDRNNDYSEETELLTTLGKHIGIVNFHINTNVKSNTIIHKNYDALAKYIDYNISHKIFFTLAIIEVINFSDIINNYNSDFYLSYKNEIIKLISNHLSTNDCIICFQKEDIYIIFNLLDSNNSEQKLQELKVVLDNYNFKDIINSTKICYALCEYPLESISTDELLAKTYRKLYKEKNA